MTAQPRKFHQCPHDFLFITQKKPSPIARYRTDRSIIVCIVSKSPFKISRYLPGASTAFLRNLRNFLKNTIEMQSFEKMKLKTSNSMADIIHSPKFSLEMKPHDNFILFTGKSEKGIEYYLTLRSISICFDDADLQKLWYSPEVYKNFVTQFIAGHSSLVAHIDITTVHPDSTEWQRIHFADIIRDDGISMRDEVIAMVLANQADRQRAMQHYESNSTHFAMPTLKPLLVLKSDSHPPKTLIYDGSCVLPPDVRLGDRAHGPPFGIDDSSTAISGGRMESNQMVSSYTRKVDIPMEDSKLTDECKARLLSKKVKSQTFFQRTGKGKYEVFLPTTRITAEDERTVKHLLSNLAYELPFSYDDVLQSVFADILFEFKNVRISIFISSTIDYSKATVQHRVVLILSVMAAVRIVSGAKYSSVPRAGKKSSDQMVGIWTGNIGWIQLRQIAKRFDQHNVEGMRDILSTLHTFQSDHDFENGGPTAFTIDSLPAWSVFHSFRTNYHIYKEPQPYMRPWQLSRIAGPRPDDLPRSQYNLDGPLPKDEVDDVDGDEQKPLVNELSAIGAGTIGQSRLIKREIDGDDGSMAHKRCKQECQPMEQSIASDQQSSSSAMHSAPRDRLEQLERPAINFNSSTRLSDGKKKHNE